MNENDDLFLVDDTWMFKCQLVLKNKDDEFDDNAELDGNRSNDGDGDDDDDDDDDDGDDDDDDEGDGDDDDDTQSQNVL